MDSTIYTLKQLSCEQFIEQFKQQMLNTYGIAVTVHKKEGSTIFPKVLLKAADELLTPYKDQFPKGLNSKNRMRLLVYYRAAFCKICFDDGINKKHIGPYIGIHRCTVIHSIKVANDLLSTKNQEFSILYNRLLSKYDEINSKNQREQDIPIV